MYHYNPNIAVRTAYISALTEFISGVPVYPDVVPKNVTIPTSYILISSQTNTRTAVAKPTEASEKADNYEWLSNIVFDVQSFSPSGYSNPGAVDYICEQVINVAENFSMDGWTVKSRVFVQSRPLNINTATNFINRQVITYQNWLQKL